MEFDLNWMVAIAMNSDVVYMQGMTEPFHDSSHCFEVMWCGHRRVG